MTVGFTPLKNERESLDEIRYVLPRHLNVKLVLHLWLRQKTSKPLAFRFTNAKGFVLKSQKYKTWHKAHPKGKI